MARREIRGLVDKAMAKIGSRKLWVWGFATGFLITDKIDAEVWCYVSMLYISAQSILDFYKVKVGK